MNKKDLSVDDIKTYMKGISNSYLLSDPEFYIYEIYNEFSREHAKAINWMMSQFNLPLRYFMIVTVYKHWMHADFTAGLTNIRPDLSTATEFDFFHIVDYFCEFKVES